MQNLPDSNSDSDKVSKFNPVKANAELDAYWELKIDWESILSEIWYDWAFT